MPTTKAKTATMYSGSQLDQSLQRLYFQKILSLKVQKKHTNTPIISFF